MVAMREKLITRIVNAIAQYQIPVNREDVPLKRLW
jgi:hypothetical protein